METLPFLPCSAYLELPSDPHAWLVQDLIPTNGLVNMYASPKVGKTFAALGLAHGINDPKVQSVFGFPIGKHGNVMFLELDTPRSFFNSRISKIKANTKNFYGDSMFFADRLMAPKGFTITNKESQLWFEKAVDAIKPVCIFIDTLREFHDQDEDSATAMKKVISIVTDTAPHSAIVFISHSRKAFQNMTDDIGNLMDDARGSGYISGRMDCIIKLTKKQFIYQSRAGKGDFLIIQRPNTGEIRRLFTDKLLLEFIKTLIERNPEYTIDQHIAIICETCDNLPQDVALAKYNTVLMEREPKAPETPQFSPDAPQSEDTKKALASLKDLPDE